TLGAVGVYSFAQKIKVGLQQLMAGSRNFRLSAISRDDLMSLTEEATKVSGIPYVMDAYRKEAEAIIDGKAGPEIRNNSNQRKVKVSVGR
ncbi:MAG: hypothetical protein NT066_08140, partial [Candidatus Omnitrophica bacterium]|nr:hypothetical protein [Candidatus Omnitrophota bacterium]